VTSANALTIAVIDSGADINTPSIRQHLWVNPGESGADAEGRAKEHNGVDDDRNGFIDDVNGWDFVNKKNPVDDPVGHGTHITGLILGDSPPTELKIMVLKYFSKSSGSGQNLAASTEAFKYALKMGAQLINFSGGGALPDADERQVLLRTAQANIPIFAAAGNESRDISQRGFFPASYGFSNILAVTSVSRTGRLSLHSNFSKTLFTVAALGDDVESDLPGQRRGRMSGTSQSTAITTGQAARLMLVRPHLQRDPQNLFQRLLGLARLQPELQDRMAHPLVIENKSLNNTLSDDLDAFGRSLKL
jgi:subtilisin family serine protease